MLDEDENRDSFEYHHVFDKKNLLEDQNKSEKKRSLFWCLSCCLCFNSK